MVVVSSTAKAMLLPFPSSSQLRLWFLLTERLLEGRGVSDTSLAAWILCPEVFGALVVWRRLQEDVGFEEGLFLWMSLVHRLLRALAHVSFFCKMWLRTFSIYAGVFRGGGGGFRRGVRAVKRRFAERGGLWLLQNVCSYVFLEIILALGAGFKLLAAEALSRLPFGGAQLVDLYCSVTMLMAIAYGLLDYCFLLASITMPLGWRAPREFPSAGARPPKQDAEYELNRMEFRVRQMERAVWFFVDPRGPRPRPRPRPRNIPETTRAVARRPQTSWPPRLPTRGPPVDDTEDAKLLRAFPDALCPISHSLLLEPVVSRSGATYDRPSIEAHLQRTPTDPVTNEPCSLEDLRPNYALRNLIDHLISTSRQQQQRRAQSTQTPLLPAKRPLPIRDEALNRTKRQRRENNKTTVPRKSRQQPPRAAKKQQQKRRSSSISQEKEEEDQSPAAERHQNDDDDDDDERTHLSQRPRRTTATTHQEEDS